jgi:hypothetical protein
MRNRFERRRDHRHASTHRTRLGARRALVMNCHRSPRSAASKNQSPIKQDDRALMQHANELRGQRSSRKLRSKKCPAGTEILTPKPSASRRLQGDDLERLSFLAPLLTTLVAGRAHGQQFAANLGIFLVGAGMSAAVWRQPVTCFRLGIDDLLPVAGSALHLQSISKQTVKIL